MKSVNLTFKIAADIDKEAKNEEKERVSARCAFLVDWLIILLIRLSKRFIIKRIIA
jgi:hypothetical protein